MSVNPYSYASKTFQSFLNDINNDEELMDKPEWFKRMIAGLGDILTLQQDADYNGNFLRTAYTRKQVFDLCQLIDYYLSPQSTSSGRIIFYAKPTVTFPFTVLKENLIAVSQAVNGVSAKYFESKFDETFIDRSGDFTVSVGTNIVTVTQDFVETGHKVRLSTTDTLPAPLATDTDYFVIYLNSGQIKLATSLDNALKNIPVVFTDTGIGFHSFVWLSKAVECSQKRTKEDFETIGQSNATQFQEFDLPDKLVLHETIEVEINSTIWTQVETFVDSGPADQVYRVLPKSDGGTYIQFGDGTYGEIPPNLSDINVKWAVGGGSDSNIQRPNGINTYAGADPNLEKASNALNLLTGGSDEQSISIAKKLAPLLLKARDRFVTSGDGEALLLSYPDIAQAKVNRLVYGPLSAQGVAVASGGGNLSVARRQEIQDELINKTVLESIDFRMVEAQIISVNIVSDAKMKGGFSFANVLPFFRVAYKLFLTETGQEIQTIYIDKGIAEAVILINNYLGEVFTSDDYANLIPLLDNLEPTNFNRTIQESDVFAYVQSNVTGIDYMTITTFASGFPLSLDTDEITTYGTLTLGEL